MTEQKTKTRSRTTLVILVALFAAPIISAYIVHKFKVLQPGGSKSYGSIVSPARPLPEINLKTLSGETFTRDSLRGKWSYIYILDGVCDEACHLNLLKTKNARLGQGAEGRRVNYYLLLTQSAQKDSNFTSLRKDFPKMTILHAGDTNLKPIIDTFANAQNSPVLNARRVYLLDPAVNYMMFYEDGFEAIGIMEDLKHLLKWSQIG